MRRPFSDTIPNPAIIDSRRTKLNPTREIYPSDLDAPAIHLAPIIPDFASQIPVQVGSHCMSTVARTLKHEYLHPLATCAKASTVPFLSLPHRQHSLRFTHMSSEPNAKASADDVYDGVTFPSTGNLFRSRRREDRGRKRDGSRFEEESGHDRVARAHAGHRIQMQDENWYRDGYA